MNNSNLMATLIHDTDGISSLEIAKLTGKRHDAILRDIRNLLKQGVATHNFVESYYIDKSNKKALVTISLQKVVLFLLLAMMRFFVKGLLTVLKN